jgi:thiol-disulfide isomerase/thioredoxin
MSHQMSRQLSNHRPIRRHLLASVAACALASLSAAPLSLAVPIKATAAKAAPDVQLTMRDGKKVMLSQLRGQVVMINFWATWCGPCRKEMPLLDAMYRKYKAMGFTLVGVNVEPDSKEAQAYLRDVPVSFPIAFDNDSKLTKVFDVQGMPSSVIIDRRGNARVVHKGYRPGDENEYLDNIRALIKE